MTAREKIHVQKDERGRGGGHTSPVSSSCKRGAGQQPCRYSGDFRSPFPLSLHLIPVLLEKMSIIERSNGLAQTELGKMEKLNPKTEEQELP